MGIPDLFFTDQFLEPQVRVTPLLKLAVSSLYPLGTLLLAPMNSDATRPFEALPKALPRLEFETLLGENPALVMPPALPLLSLLNRWPLPTPEPPDHYGPTFVSARLVCLAIKLVYAIYSSTGFPPI